jgi:hypothetical protein
VVLTITRAKVVSSQHLSNGTESIHNWLRFEYIFQCVACIPLLVKDGLDSEPSKEQGHNTS